MIKSSEELIALMRAAHRSFKKSEWEDSLTEQQAFGLHVADYLANYYLESSGSLLDAVYNITNDRAGCNMRTSLYTMTVFKILN